MVFVATIAAAALMASPQGWRPPSLCAAREPLTFTCPVKDRLLSVCGEGARAVYRFGRPGHVEVEAGTPTFVMQGFSGGGETQATFHNGGVGYLVYQSTVRTGFGRGGNKPVFSDGVAVRRGGKTIGNRLCTGTSGGDLTTGMEKAPAAEFVDR